MTDLHDVVNRSADAAQLHAPVPTLLLEIQTLLGTLSATVTAGTNRGRGPFRADANWAARLGDLAYHVYLLADQSGVDLNAAVAATAARMAAQRSQATGLSF